MVGKPPRTVTKKSSHEVALAALLNSCVTVLCQESNRQSIHCELDYMCSDLNGQGWWLAGTAPRHGHRLFANDTEIVS